MSKKFCHFVRKRDRQGNIFFLFLADIFQENCFILLDFRIFLICPVSLTFISMMFFWSRFFSSLAKRKPKLTKNELGFIF